MDAPISAGLYTGRQLSVLAGLDRKAEMQLYASDDFDLSPNSYDCIVSSEAHQTTAILRGIQSLILLKAMRAIEVNLDISWTTDDLAAAVNVGQRQFRLKFRYSEIHHTNAQLQAAS